MADHLGVGVGAGGKGKGVGVFGHLISKTHYTMYTVNTNIG